MNKLVHRFRTLPFLLLLSWGPAATGQVHALPEHQGMGIPGPVPRSYVITWHPAPEAVGYEYVLTDNFLCFAGCAGDTRTGVVTDTFLLAYELLEGRPYYWITRVQFADSSFSPWSLISQFQAESPPVAPLVTIAPNPVRGPVRVQLDWGAIPDADFVRVTAYSLNGRQFGQSLRISPEYQAFRRESQSWSQLSLPPGIQMLVFEAATQDGRVLRRWSEKIVVQEP